jgi:hypothetical protein
MVQVNSQYEFIYTYINHWIVKEKGYIRVSPKSSSNGSGKSDGRHGSTGDKQINEEDNEYE